MPRPPERRWSFATPRAGAGAHLAAWVAGGVCAVEFPYPKERFAGRGIVICGGGEKYLPSVFVLVRLLRHLRCQLPIEVWHLGREEMPDAMRSLLAEQGAVCMDGAAMRRVHPARRLGGWELKCYALLHSTFAEVLLLDADNCPVRNPEFLFRTSKLRGARRDVLAGLHALCRGAGRRVAVTSHPPAAGHMSDGCKHVLTRWRGACIWHAHGFPLLSRRCEIRGIGLPVPSRVFMMLLPCVPRCKGFGMARPLTQG